MAKFSLGESRASSRRSSFQAPASNGVGSIPDLDEFGDADGLSGFAQGLQEKEDPAQFNPSLGDGLGPLHSPRSSPFVTVRTYDCMITYDKYYQTPRMWLIGYDENGLPLQPNQIFEDVASDYAFKTVTIEPFPHGSPGAGAMDSLLASRSEAPHSPRNLSVHVASIHPCKHASMMRKMIQRMNDSGQYREQDSPPDSPPLDTTNDKDQAPWTSALRRVWGTAKATPPQDTGGVRVDQYLVIFLKFMASIVPTIEIDATQAV